MSFDGAYVLTDESDDDEEPPKPELTSFSTPKKPSTLRMGKVPKSESSESEGKGYPTRV